MAVLLDLLVLFMLKINRMRRFLSSEGSGKPLPEAYIAYKNKDYQKAMDIYKNFADKNPIAQFGLVISSWFRCTC